MATYKTAYTREAIKCVCGRQAVSKGLCNKCYMRAYNKIKYPNAIARGEYGIRHGMATCHPDRPMKRSDGLCGPCHQRVLLYKLTLDDLITMYKAQNGLCKLCKSPYEQDALIVEHNHTTGKVRGLVCQSCNIVISNAEHPLIHLALAYVEEV